MQTTNNHINLMIHEFTKTVTGLFSTICAFLFTATAMASVDIVVRIISGVFAIAASCFAMVYYYRQMKVNNHIKKRK